MMIMMDKKKTLNQIMGPVPTEEKKEEMGELDALSDEVLVAIEAKDPVALKDALKAFFYACDAQPHEEGEHTEG